MVQLGIVPRAPAPAADPGAQTRARRTLQRQLWQQEDARVNPDTLRSLVATVTDAPNAITAPGWPILLDMLSTTATLRGNGAEVLPERQRYVRDAPAQHLLHLYGAHSSNSKTQQQHQRQS